MGAILIPDWPAGTVAVLATSGPDGAPRALPVSTAMRASDDVVLLALGRRRVSLQALRDRPACALALLAAGNVAVTLHGRARVLADGPAGAEGIAVVALDVHETQDHTTDRFVIADGVQWSWIDEDARARDAQVRAVLLGLSP
jgi:hypothetical protein